MRKQALLALAALPFLIAAAPAPEQIRDKALHDDSAWDIVEGLTTEIGPRLAGTEAEARARDWAVAKLKALGFQNVHIEPFNVPAWVRGEERAEIIAPFPQRLVLTALGNSGATAPQGLDAEVVVLPSFAALMEAPAGSLKGKIVYVGHNMKRTQDGSSYGYWGRLRFGGPSIAARKGAAAILIRSIGTDNHRVAHAGLTRFEPGVTPIPAAALSNPDADLLEHAAERGKPVRIHLVLTPRALGQRQSGNVVADLPGTDPSAGTIVIGGHLDSWDLGTGAIDDAAGVAITTAAAKQIMDSGMRPRRTIRVVWFGSEEIGGGGGEAYLDAHKSEKIALAGESDFGADRVWRFNVTMPPAATALANRIELLLEPLGIERGREAADGGADAGPLIKAGAPGIDLNQDGLRYFDIHHTADDTLDKIDPAQLRQNVAAWAAVLAAAADAPEPLEGPTH